MSRSISSTNVVFMLAISGLYVTPQQIQGLADDDFFDFDDFDVSEDHMGIDGRLSAGLVYSKKPQSITLQANSESIIMFDAWFAAEQASRDKYFANGIITMPSINYSYVLTNGNLSKYSPMSNAKKVLQPRKFTINWENIVGAPL